MFYLKTVKKHNIIVKLLIISLLLTTKNVYAKCKTNDTSSTKISVSIEETKQMPSELSIKTKDYSEKLDKNKLIFIDNLKPMARIFLPTYQLYNIVDNYEKNKDDLKQQIKDSDDLSYTIKSKTSWYEQQGDKYVHKYAQVPQNLSPIIATTIFNLDRLQIVNEEILKEINQEKELIKKTPNKKSAYDKNELKELNNLQHRAKRDFNKVKDLNKALNELAEANKITIYANQSDSEYLAIDPKVANYPDIKELEEEILKDNKYSNLGGDTAAYYKQVDSIRLSILPTLSSLLLSSDKSKELELRKKYVLEQSANLSEKEKEAQMTKLLQEEEAAIMDALESSDINNKLANFTAEQKQQYAEVNKQLANIFVINVNMLINQASKAYNLYNAYKADPLNAALNQVNNLPSQEELLYISLVRKNATESSKKLQEKLNELNKINKLDEQVVVETKTKKAKKVKNLDLE